MPHDPRPQSEVDSIIASLQSPSAPPRAPDWPAESAPAARAPGALRSRPWLSALGIVTALAASLLLAFHRHGEPESLSTQRFRGLGGTPVEVDLRLVSQRGEVVTRVPRDVPLQVGDAIYFRAEASRHCTLQLRVQSDLKIQEIARFQAGPVSADVKTAEGWLAWVAEAPGVYTFVLSAGESPECDAPSCKSVEVLVQ